jgi:FlaA1/EpsC-like NDP-sugar epimerase
MNLLRRVRADPTAPYEIAGFLDDDPAKRHLMLQMTPVLGNGDELPRLARLHQVDEILIAIPSPAPSNRRRFRELARFARVRCRFPTYRKAAPAP